MKLLLMLAVMVLPAVALAADAAPEWAFVLPNANPPKIAQRVGPYTLPGSSRSYTQLEIDNDKLPPDWFPASHGPLPRAMTTGGDGMALACAACHLVSGMGRPEAGTLAGMPAEYLEQQMADFRSGARANHAVPTATTRTDLVLFMAAVARSWPSADSTAAINYYASLKPLKGWVRVVETDTVATSYINTQYARRPAPGSQREPLGQRIIELPQVLERTLLRDPNSGSVAYVPVGSIARGRALVSRGPVACAACHGSNLQGSGNVPSIAGHSPYNIFRQMFLYKQGSRNGPMASAMRPYVASYSQTDMIDVAAYLGTINP